MSSPPEAPLEPTIAAWLARLIAQHLWTPNAAEAKDVARLVASRPSWSPPELASCLASILAKDEAQWQELDKHGREYFERARAESEAATTSMSMRHPTSEGPSTPRRLRRWHLAGAVLSSVIGLIAVGVWAVWTYAPRVPWPDITPATIQPPPEPQQLITEDRRIRFEPLSVEPAKPIELEDPAPAQFDGTQALLAAIAGLLAALAGRWWFASAPRGSLAIAPVPSATGPSPTGPTIPYHVQRFDPFPVGPLEDAATMLGRLGHDLADRRVDVPNSIDRTTRCGGEPEIVFHSRRDAAEILVLVDVEGDDRVGGHPHLDAIEWVLQRWRRGGLTLVRFDFRYRPYLLRDVRTGARVGIGVLGRRYHDVPVLVFSRFRSPHDMHGHQPKWLSELRAWPRRVWIDAQSERSRHDAESVSFVRLARHAGLHRFPLTPWGLGEAARALDSAATWDLPVVARRRPPRVRPPDEHLLLWAACACLVPNPTWAQLESLRRLLVDRGFALHDRECVDALVEYLGRYTGDTASDGGPELRIGDAHRPDLVARLIEYDRSRGPAGNANNRKGEPDRDGLEWATRTLLLEQLAAAVVEHDAYEKERRDLKVALHEAALGRRSLADVVDRYGCSQVADDLESWVRELLATLRKGRDRRFSGAEIEGIGAFLDGRRGAALGDLVPWRKPVPGEVATCIGLATVAVIGVGVAWSLDDATPRTATLVTPPTYEVILPDPVELPPAGCTADVIALADTAPMVMKCIPAGKFLMGSPLTEPGRGEDEGPQHVAHVASLWVGQTEVTQRQWTAVMGNALFDCESGCGDTLPAHSISWRDAVMFSNALSKREGLAPCYVEVNGEWTWPDKLCAGYRLPTETEWEYAARAGTTTAYSFGAVVGQLGEYEWFGGNAEHRLHAASGKLQNPWGLFDMHGNVQEWVWDWYADYPAEETPEGYEGGPGVFHRAVRGGSYTFVPEYLRSAVRGSASTDVPRMETGFRCVRGVLSEPSTP